MYKIRSTLCSSVGMKVASTASCRTHGLLWIVRDLWSYLIVFVSFNEDVLLDHEDEKEKAPIGKMPPLSQQPLQQLIYDAIKCACY